jgi:cbb3-type cytochrome oxidase cytochrome c subunit
VSLARRLGLAVGLATAACSLPWSSRRHVVDGETLFVRHGCNGCHTIGVTGTPIGPPLDRVGREHDAAYFVRWLHDPTAQKPKAHMPPIAMPEDEARALASYLASLR